MPTPKFPGKHLSLWIDTVQIPRFEELIEDIEVDVTVIGAGIVGVLTAYHLKEAGYTVALVESREVLEGVTGNTTAKLTAAHDLIYQHLVSQFGEDQATLYARANMNAIAWVEATAKHHKISCDFVRRNLYLYASTKKEAEEIEKEEAAARTAGLEVELLKKIDVPFPHKNALRIANQAEFHPLKFLIPLLNKIPGNGSAVYTHTRVTDVTEGDPCTVTTNRGTITSRYVVLATHFPIFDPGFYYARLNPFRDYAIAVTLDEPVPEDMYVSPDESYTLRSQGDELIIGGGMHKVGEGGDTTKYYQDLEEFAKKYYKVKEVTHSWSTQDNGTVDRVPYIGRISARAQSVFVATGFGGWGMAHGVVAAQLITDLINGKENPYEGLYSPLRFKPITSATELVKEGISTVQHFIGDRLAHGAKKKAASMKPGDAAILEIDGEKLAVYKGRDGEIHALSPICTHMGCTVAWNPAEESWDCPCHGSRFSATGEVLHGPAVKDLEKKEIPQK
jgi:glycine/D-amino acid oxidase-like deaminating enzyme/nitrite reductase/ring-hydroxylating ferredoxin subunit